NQEHVTLWQELSECIGVTESQLGQGSLSLVVNANVGDPSLPLGTQSCLKASRIRNIEGKTIGKDGKPMCAIRKPIRVISSCDENPNVAGDSSLKDKTSQSVNVNKEAGETSLNDSVRQPLSAVEEVSSRFTNTLYGYFIGKRRAFRLVENYVKNTWAKYGLKHVQLHDDFFLFQFESKEGMDKVLENGPWLIRTVPLILNVWSSNTDLKKAEVKKALVWIKLHHVPIVAYLEFVGQEYVC
ncbi:zinc knuckle CX2CX4HX4C containing protein, partial [Tanacetum coccineum]